MALKLLSNSFTDGAYLADRHTLSESYGFGCAGGNVSPEMHWKGLPDGTKSMVLTCYDPDAPTGSGFWHWVMTNIPSDATSISEGSGNLPSDALETRTDFGVPGYSGPCPPEGDHPHRYIFTLFCLSVDALPIEADTSAAVVGFLANMNVIEKTTLIAFSKR